jgi:prepilin-type processing-associated H-X9-DG protein
MFGTERGFSYIELLISVTIISIAYVVMFGAGSKWGQTRRKAGCAANLAKMHMVLSVYAAEQDGGFPTVTGATTSEAALTGLVPRYTTDTSIFICPGGNQAELPSSQPFADRRISYAYYMGLNTRTASPDMPLVSDAQVNLAAKRKGDPLFSESGKAPGHNHRRYGGNVLFVDGHVETGDAMATRDFPVPGGTVLLNPKP